MHESSAYPLDTSTGLLDAPYLSPIPPLFLLYAQTGQEDRSRLQNSPTQTRLWQAADPLFLGFHNTGHAIGRNSRTAYKMWM